MESASINSLALVHFSLLNSSFSGKQTSSLEDYVESLTCVCVKFSNIISVFP